MKTTTGIIIVAALAGAYMLFTKKEGVVGQEAAAPSGVAEGVVATSGEIAEAKAQKIREGQPDATISQTDIGNLRERQITAAYQAQQFVNTQARLETQQQAIGASLAAQQIKRASIRGSAAQTTFYSRVKDETGTRIYRDREFIGWEGGTMTAAGKVAAATIAAKPRTEQAGSAARAKAQATIRAGLQKALTGKKVSSKGKWKAV